MDKSLIVDQCKHSLKSEVAELIELLKIVKKNCCDCLTKECDECEHQVELSMLMTKSIPEAKQEAVEQIKKEVEQEQTVTYDSDVPKGFDNADEFKDAPETDEGTFDPAPVKKKPAKKKRAKKKRAKKKGGK